VSRDLPYSDAAASGSPYGEPISGTSSPNAIRLIFCELFDPIALHLIKTSVLEWMQGQKPGRFA